MSLTQNDLAQIRTIVIDAFETLAVPRFDNIEGRLDKLEKTQDEHTVILREHSSMLREHGQRLTSIESKLIDIEGRLQALEADVKELYAITAEIQSSNESYGGKFSEMNTEQKVLAMYRDFQSLAKELGIKLPAA